MVKLDKIKLNKICLKYKVKIVYLFGSQATGKITPLSDFDFAVQFSSKVKEKDYFDYQIRLITEFGKLVKTDKVDVVVLNSKKTSLLLKRNVIDGKIIYCSDEDDRVYFEAGIMRRFSDWSYFEEIYHQIFIRRLAGEF